MLQVSNITKYYGDTPILRGVSFTINPGDRWGLIGPNGCGKTTLLRIITGEIAPDTGSVRTDPPDLRVGHLEQGLTYAAEDTLDTVLRAVHAQVATLESRIEALGIAMATATGAEQDRLLDAYGAALADLERLTRQQTAEHIAEALLAGLGLGHLDLETPVRILSGGQKTRLGLARLLIREPRLLLLDEPTNHLDIEALEWLETWLTDYAGGVIIVSHDRTFLDGAVTGILDLDARTHAVTAYPGNYSAYLDIKQRELERQWEAYHEQQERVARLTGEARRLSGYANSIEQGTIDFGPRKIAKGIARRATVQRRRIERELDRAHIEKPPQSMWQMKLMFEDIPPSGQDVFILKDLAAGYDGRAIFTGVNAYLRQGERVALIGPNGAGKTTLLRVLAGQLAPLAGEARRGAGVKLGYYAQEQETLPPDSTPFDAIRAVADMSDTDVRSFLHYFLFTGDEVFMPARSLSYGERARLVLARLVAQGCNCLLLDEPINHLDIPGRASFEHAMTAFTGTVVAVVHDRYFIQHFATRLWAVEAGTVRSYVDLEEYRRVRRRASG